MPRPPRSEGRVAAARRAQDALEIGALRGIEGVVLSGKDCLDKLRRHVRGLDRDASLFAKLGDQRAIGRIDPQRDLESITAQVLERRQRVRRVLLDLCSLRVVRLGPELGDIAPVISDHCMHVRTIECRA